MQKLRTASRHSQGFSSGLIEKVQTLEIRLLPAASSLLLSSLNGTNGATFYGIDTAITSPADFGDRSGWSVSSVGDVNGDGFDDMFVAAPFADGNPNSLSKYDSGECYLVFGKPDWSSTSSMSFSNLNGTNGVTFSGIDLQDNAGYSVSRAGDVNNDGFADLLIGAPLADGVGNASTNAGESYLIFGKSDWSITPTVNLSTLDGTNGVTFYGVDAGDKSGTEIRGVGDTNGDGFDDFIIAAPESRGINNAATLGESYLVFGKSDWSGNSFVQLSSLNGTNGVTLYGSYATGIGIGQAGDVNGDGLDDILIKTSSQAVQVALVFGHSDWSSTPMIDLMTLGSPQVIKFSAIDSGDDLSVSSKSGDVNGDGLDDLFIGSPTASGLNNQKQNSGETYLIFGRTDWSNPPTLTNLNGTNGVRFYGVDIDDFAGTPAIVGDLNGDGFDDLAVTALLADGITNSASETGEVYVIYGKENWKNTPALNLSALNGNNGYTIYGINDHDRAGVKSGGGDVNGDGYDDLLIGALLADSINNSLDQAGEAYIVFGFDTANPLIDQIGVKRNAQFYEDLNNSFTSNPGDRTFSFGNPTDLPLVGDWNDDGIDEIGVFRSGSWYLDLNGNNIWDGNSGGDIVFTFGNPTDSPLIGDWNADGIDDVGVKRGDAYYLDTNGNRTWNGTGGGDSLYHFGNAGDSPVTGDWSGNGSDKIGVFRNGTFYLDQNGNGDWNDIAGGDSRFGYGMAGDKPIVGDWNGDGISDVGVVRGNSWYLDQNGNRAWNGTIGGDALFTYGNSTDTPIIGNWTAPSPSPKPGSPTQLDTLFAQLAPPAKKPS